MLPNEAKGFREKLVLAYINKHTSVKQLCRLFGTTRKTILKWVKRYLKHGKEGLKELSRAPRRVWNKVARWIECLVCSLFKLGIKPTEIWQAISDHICEKTVYNILHRNGLFSKDKLKQTCQRYEYVKANQLWHIDITKFKIKKQGRFYIFAALDDYSRYLLHIAVYRRMRSEEAAHFLSRAFKLHGYPEAILTDCGRQFISKDLRDWLPERVKHRRTRPWNPKCNGKIERWFRDLKEELRKNWYNSPEELIKAINRFVLEYNKKPKRVLGWKSPADRYC